MNTAELIAAPEVSWDSPTRELLRVILISTRTPDAKFKFVCPHSEVGPLLSRLRMMLSRVRNDMRVRNVRFKQFRLMSEVHQTMNPRMALVIIWQSQSQSQQFDEMIERALSA